MAHETLVEVGEGIELRVLVRDADRDAPQIQFLLVHGLASNAHLWDGVAEALAELGHPSAAVDLRGHGPCGPGHVLDDAAALSFETVAVDLVTVTKALGWDRPVAVGQSWGANVVVELGARHGELVRGIACVDGGTIELANHFADFDACWAALQPPQLAGTPRFQIEQYLRSAHPDWPETGIAGQLANFENVDETIRPWLTRDRHRTILEHLFSHRPSLRWADLADTPTMFVPAEHASAQFTKHEEIDAAAAALSSSRVHWMRGDHDLHAQFPEQVAALLHAACVDGFYR